MCTGSACAIQCIQVMVQGLGSACSSSPANDWNARSCRALSPFSCRGPFSWRGPFSCIGPFSSRGPFSFPPTKTPPPSAPSSGDARVDWSAEGSDTPAASARACFGERGVRTGSWTGLSLLSSEYSRANSYPWSLFPLRRSRPGHGPHRG